MQIPTGQELRNNPAKVIPKLVQLQKIGAFEAADCCVKQYFELLGSKACRFCKNDYEICVSLVDKLAQDYVLASLAAYLHGCSVATLHKYFIDNRLNDAIAKVLNPRKEKEL